MKPSVLLIHPPVFKPCEPPAGLAKIAGFLKSRGVPCHVLDASAEGLLHLFQKNPASKTRRSQMALHNRDANLRQLKALKSYGNRDHYNRMVSDLNHLLAQAGKPFNAHISFSDFQQESLVPVSSASCQNAASRPETNPFFDYFAQAVPPAVKIHEVTHLGISVNFLSQVLCAFALAGMVKTRFPHVKIIFGGSLITSWMRNPAWSHPFSEIIDVTVAGPGERYFANEFNLAPPSEGLTLPDYASFPLSDYLSPLPVIPYAASRGCWWRRCSFCPETAESSQYESIPPQQVMRDLSFIHQTWPHSLIHFVDNALPPDVLTALTRSGFSHPWYGYVRFTRHLEEESFCRRLKQSGCVMLKLGVESGNQRVLNAMNKGITLPQIEKTLNYLKNAGIATFIYLLFGTPQETETEARDTLRFIARLAPAVTFINAAIFYLPVLSHEAPSLSTREFYDGDLALYTDYDHPQGWNRQRVRHFLDKEFRKEAALSNIVKNTPPSFTSNHAPFRWMSYEQY